MVSFDNFLNDFQEFCVTTAVYPKTAGLITYPVLGLLGEWGEVLRAADWDEIEAELGDCFWYVSTIASEIGTRLSVIVSMAFNRRFDNYDQTAMFELAQIAKRRLRDGTSDIIVIEEMLSLVVVHLMRKLMEIPHVFKAEPEIALRQILSAVRVKLQSRLERNMLHGTGDHR